MEMKSMKLAKSVTKQMISPEPADYKEPEYPWGLKINLDSDSLKKLGIKELPKVGETMMLSAEVYVCDLHLSESEHGENKSLGLQITDLAIGEKEKKKSTKSVLYGEN